MSTKKPIRTSTEPVQGRKIGASMREVEGKLPKINIASTLAERGTRYGVFTEHARITQNLKDVMKDSPNWKDLSPDKKEALEMTVHKIGRILNGDPEYADSWHDIQGYCKLVEDTL